MNLKKVIFYAILAIIVFFAIYIWIGWQNYVALLQKVNDSFCQRPIPLNISLP